MNASSTLYFDFLRLWRLTFSNDMGIWLRTAVIKSLQTLNIFSNISTLEQCEEPMGPQGACQSHALQNCPTHDKRRLLSFVASASGMISQLTICEMLGGECWLYIEALCR
jgi:hypothetical protein